MSKIIEMKRSTISSRIQQISARDSEGMRHQYPYSWISPRKNGASYPTRKLMEIITYKKKWHFTMRHPI